MECDQDEEKTNKICRIGEKEQGRVVNESAND
jgi:hypothetical protein